MTATYDASALACRTAESVYSTQSESYASFHTKNQQAAPPLRTPTPVEPFNLSTSNHTRSRELLTQQPPQEPRARFRAAAIPKTH